MSLPVPVEGCVLVKLSENIANIDLPDKQYSTKTSGEVVADAFDKDISGYLGKQVWFEEYKDGCQVEVDGELYAFIKLEDIRGCMP